MKIYIFGSRTDKTLPKVVKEQLDIVCSKNVTLLVGDAYGTDGLVQNYLRQKSYPNVYVYTTDSTPRHNLGQWEVCRVPNPYNYTGYRFYALKDRQMIKDSDASFGIWSKNSSEIVRNISDLLEQHKKCVIYHTASNELVLVENTYDLNKLKARWT